MRKEKPPSVSKMKGGPKSGSTSFPRITLVRFSFTLRQMLLMTAPSGKGERERSSSSSAPAFGNFRPFMTRQMRTSPLMKPSRMRTWRRRPVPVVSS